MDQLCALPTTVMLPPPGASLPLPPLPVPSPDPCPVPPHPRSPHTLHPPQARTSSR